MDDTDEAGKHTTVQATSSNDLGSLERAVARSWHSGDRETWFDSLAATYSFGAWNALGLNCRSILEAKVFTEAFS